MFSGDRKWGAIGASAAIAWSPEINSTWELVAWRDNENIGTERTITPQAVREMEESHPRTFVNRDPTKGKGLIAPELLAPYYMEFEETLKKSVEEAHHWLQSRGDVEESSRFAVHVTNQLSDDHVISSGSPSYLILNTPRGHTPIYRFPSMVELPNSSLLVKGGL